MKMSKIAILYDVDGWAYHAESKSMQKYLKRNNINCDIFPYPFFYSKMNEKDRLSYSGVFLFPRQARPLTFPAEKTIVKFSSFGDFSNQGSLNSFDFRHIICTNKQILKKAIEQIGDKNKNIVYLPLCIDSEHFSPHESYLDEKRGKLTVGFAGNSQRAGKGFELIQQAIQKLGNNVNFITATYHGKDRLTYDNMPNFYRNIDLLLCMSKEEGGPLTAFEAGMCGVPTISGCEKSAINEVTVPDYDSFHIKRDVNSLVLKIKEIDSNRKLLLNAKKNIYKKMYLEHSWEKQIKSYINLLKTLY